MTNHAGPRRCECQPGTKFGQPTRLSNPALAPKDRFWRPFLFMKKFISMKQYSNLNHFQQLLFHTFPTHFNIIFFGLTKTGAKTAPRVPKLGYFVGRVPKVSSRVILVGGRRGLSYFHFYSKTRD